MSQGLYQCYYEAFVRKHVFNALGMSSTGFLQPAYVRGCAAAFIS